MNFTQMSCASAPSNSNSKASKGRTNWRFWACKSLPSAYVQLKNHISSEIRSASRTQLISIDRILTSFDSKPFTIQQLDLQIMASNSISAWHLEPRPLGGNGGPVSYIPATAVAAQIDGFF